LEKGKGLKGDNMTTGEKTSSVAAIITAILAIALAVWGGAFRAGQAINDACNAKTIAVEAIKTAHGNETEIRTLQTDIKYIVKSVDEIKDALK